MAFLVFTLLAGALSAGTQQRVNPVEKVTELLEKLQAEVEAEGKSEAAAYDKYACFCKEQADNKQYAIEKFIEQENLLEANIDDKTPKKNALDSEVQEHNLDKAALDSEQESKQTQRDTEFSAYETHDKLLTSAIDALGNAIDALQASKKDMVDSKDGYTLLSKHAELIKSSLLMAESLHLSKGGAQLMRLLQQPDTAHAYSYHSNEIVSTLESLLKNFREQKVAADNDERQTRQSFEMASGARANQIKALVKSATEKSEAAAALEEEINTHKADLKETQDAHQADQNFLDDLTAKCEQKAKDFDQRSSTRSAELQAISEALNLLKSKVSDMYPATNLGLVVKSKVVKPDAPAPKEGGHWEWVPDQAAVQTEKKEKQGDDSEEDAEEDADDAPVSFLQVDRPNAAARKQLVAFLTDKAKTLKSTALNTLLLKLRSTASPFAKVKQMIQDLVERLEAEAQSEADQKQWCDTEMSTATSNRDEAQTKIEDLNAYLTEKNALVDQRTEEIATLAQEIADLQKALNEATELREEENKKNQATIADATAGKTAVSQAIDFLEDFYGTSLIQTGDNPAPAAEGYERWSAEGAGSDGKTVDDLAPDAGGVSGEYGGKTDSAKGIIGMLEVIESDFENSITTTTDEENTAESDYQSYKSDTEGSIDSKTTLKGTKEDEKKTAELDIVDKEADLKSEKTNLQNALDELEKLKPVCVDTGMSWEERTARREQEIESLKEALKILQNTDFGFLQH